MRNDLYIANVLAGFREDVRNMESFVEVEPLIQAALERLERRMLREDARKILLEVFYDTQRT